MKDLKKEKSSIAEPEIQQVENTGILIKVDLWIRKGCLYLQYKFEGLSGVAKMLLLTLFCVSGVCYNIRVIVDNTSPGSNRLFHRINPIPAPVNIITQGITKLSTKPGLSEADYQKITIFLDSLESLRKSPEGNRLYQQFISKHPGIIDSIQYIQKLYNLRIRRQDDRAIESGNKR